jgi:folate-binding protein YgfZ
MIANFRLFKYQQNFFLSLKKDLVERSISHLQNYVLRAQVAVQDISEQLIHLGLSGDNATALLSTFIDNINETVDSVSHNDDYIAIRVAGRKPRYEIFCSIEHAKALWEKISAQAEAVNSSSWDYLNIQAGIPFIDVSSCEEFVPQMANMELINGVSFTKGCYTGQEIVARMHYLGKLKKRCYKVHIDTETKPHAGDKLFAEDAKAGQNTGAIIQAEKNPAGGYDALAVIQIADTESKLFLKDADGPAIAIKELPYRFDKA